MNTALWVAQSVLAVVFLYSGIMKATQTKQRLVAIGQTGVEGLPLWLIRFIGLSEIAGAIGLILPYRTQITPVLTPLSALCLGAIMIPAAAIHFRRREFAAVLLNVILFLLCGWVAYSRWGGIK